VNRPPSAPTRSAKRTNGPGPVPSTSKISWSSFRNHLRRVHPRGRVDGLGRHHEGRPLHGLGKAILRYFLQLDGERSRVGQRPQGRAEPGFGEDRRVEAVGELPKLVALRLCLLPRRTQQGGQFAGAVAFNSRPSQEKLVREGQDPLWDPVVQVSLQPTALFRGVPEAGDHRLFGSVSHSFG
jgi:hypothetical protein